MREQPFDLLLTDLTMPDIDASRLRAPAARLTANWPAS